MFSQSVHALHLFRGVTPLLESVKIARVKAVWTSPMWCNLRSLELDEVEGLEPDRLPKILKACPALHTLAVLNFPFAKRYEAGSSTESSILLSSLKSLALESIPIDMLTFLIARIQSPSLETLRLSAPESDTDEDPNIQTIVAFVLDFLQRVTPGQPNSTITLGDDDFRISTVGLKSPQLVIGLRGLDGVVGDVCESPTFHAPTAVLEGYINSVSLAWWGLSDRRGITTVYAIVYNVPDILRRPSTEEDGTVTWPFPDMHTLIFHPEACDEDGSEILSMVRSRTGQYDDEGDMKIEHPAALQKMIFPHGYAMNPEILIGVRMILGEGVLVWENAPGPQEL